MSVTAYERVIRRLALSVGEPPAVFILVADDSFCAFEKHSTDGIHRGGSGTFPPTKDQTSKSHGNTFPQEPGILRPQLETQVNGRTRFRTCDPCRVKAVLYR